MQDCLLTFMPKQYGPHKPKVASTRLRKRDWETLEKLASQSGKTLADYLRDVVLKHLKETEPSN